jgi:hypothetical protein
MSVVSMTSLWSYEASLWTNLDALDSVERRVGMTQTSINKHNAVLVTILQVTRSSTSIPS